MEIPKEVIVQKFEAKVKLKVVSYSLQTIPLTTTSFNSITGYWKLRKQNLTRSRRPSIYLDSQYIYVTRLTSIIANEVDVAIIGYTTSKSRATRVSTSTTEKDNKLNRNNPANEK
ncbi:hypothetical protein ACJMK2_037616 [Sinanodonta woodiana]|uniref:Uncharacterized protein n=1 Tax=Sinanodonta woodiana TaxID=1069815 RepID=A0ABD3WQ79_SINWO